MYIIICKYATETDQNSLSKEKEKRKSIEENHLTVLLSCANLFRAEKQNIHTE